MNHGSLFSGIGGFDLAAEWMGWNNVFHCEWNPFGQRVLKHYWPNAKSYNDITKSDFSVHRGQIDILTGGFPCQPYSLSGSQKGDADHRHLWPEMLRAIKQIKPRWIVGENVPGLTTWDNGRVFESICSELEQEGYQVQSFVISASAIGARHKRSRLWIVANASIQPNLQANTKVCTKREVRKAWQNDRSGDWRAIPELGRESSTPRVLGATDGVPNWMERNRAYGNAINPHSALMIFQTIQKYEALRSQLNLVTA